MLYWSTSRQTVSTVNRTQVACVAGEQGAIWIAYAVDIRNSHTTFILSFSIIRYFLNLICYTYGSTAPAPRLPGTAGSGPRMLGENTELFQTLLWQSDMPTTSLGNVLKKNAQVGSRSRYVITCPSGSGSIIQDYGSVDPDPKEIFTNPEHWF